MELSLEETGDECIDQEVSLPTSRPSSSIPSMTTSISSVVGGYNANDDDEEEEGRSSLDAATRD